MARMKDVMLYICEMWHQKKSVTEIIGELNREYPGAEFTERVVVDTLIEYYQAVYEEGKIVGADFNPGDVVVFTHDADGVKKGTLGAFRGIFNGWVEVHIPQVGKSEWYRADHPVPFKLLCTLEDPKGE